MSENASFPNKKYVKINDREVEVKKLGLIKYAILTKELNALISSIIRIFQMDTEVNQVKDDVEVEFKQILQDRRVQMSRIISDVVSENVEQVVKFLSIAVPDLEKAYIEENVGLDDMFNLIEAIIEVNNLNKVVGDVKKFMSLLTGTPN
jgi:hypothetical protein